MPYLHHDRLTRSNPFLTLLSTAMLLAAAAPSKAPSQYGERRWSHNELMTRRLGASRRRRARPRRRLLGGRRARLRSAPWRLAGDPQQGTLRKTSHDRWPARGPRS
jgi:hypothetical protein